MSANRSYDAAAATGRRARALLIELTHVLPEEAPEDLVRLWNEADIALLAFLRRMDDEVYR